jgi:hypothetical protein
MKRKNNKNKDNDNKEKKEKDEEKEVDENTEQEDNDDDDKSVRKGHRKTRTEGGTQATSRNQWRRGIELETCCKQ